MLSSDKQQLRQGTCMMLGELEQQLQQTVAEGRIGTPVALRVHLQSAGDGTPVGDFVYAIFMARSLFGNPPERVMVRGDLHQQATALVTYASGATLVVSAGQCSGETSTIQLLLIGNHGIANLEPALFTGGWPANASIESAHWQESLAESHATGTAVTL